MAEVIFLNLKKVKFEVNCFIKATNKAGKNPKLLDKLDLSQAFIYESSIEIKENGE